LCGAPVASFGVQHSALPNLEVPLMAVACQACGHILLFNEAMILGDMARSSP
jgi:hypothetical protein